MTDLMHPPAPESAKEAKARAKAEKAYGKAVRPWYKKPLLAIPAAIVAIAIISNALSGGDAPTSPVSDETAGVSTVAEETVDKAPADKAPAKKAPAEKAPAAAPAPKLPGIGDAVKDGKFTFVVQSFKCGKDSVGNSFMREEAQGQYCLMDVSVENHGDEPQMLFSDNQLVFDAKGREFANDAMAAMSIDGNDQVWMEEINPGNSVQGTMVFDVPKNAEIVSARLHDSMLSGGVEISLK